MCFNTNKLKIHPFEKVNLKNGTKVFNFWDSCSVVGPSLFLSNKNLESNIFSPGRQIKVSSVCGPIKHLSKVARLERHNAQYHESHG